MNVCRSHSLTAVAYWKLIFPPSRLKRKLELESCDPHVLQDGDVTSTTKTPSKNRHEKKKRQVAVCDFEDIHDGECDPPTKTIPKSCSLDSSRGSIHEKAVQIKQQDQKHQAVAASEKKQAGVKKHGVLEQGKARQRQKNAALKSRAVSSPSAGASLMEQTQRFVKMLDCAVDGVLDINIASWELNISKRCIYTISRALEGIKLVKKSNNKVQWLGRQTNASLHPELKALQDEEEKLDELIEGCMQHIYEMHDDINTWRLAYVTYEDVQNIPSLKGQTLIAIKAPTDTKVEVSHPEQSLQVRVCSIYGPVEAFICSDIDMDMHTQGSTSTWPPDLVSPSFDSPLCHLFSNEDTKEGFSDLKPPLELLTNLPPVTTRASPLQDPESDQGVVSSLPFRIKEEEDDLSLAQDDGTSNVLSSTLDPAFVETDLPRPELDRT